MNTVTPSLDANGRDRPGSVAATAAKAPPTQSGLQARDVRQLRHAVGFAQVVAVLMRDKNFRSLRLSELETLVLPAIMSGQWRIAQAPQPSPTAGKSGAEGRGVLLPIGVALWASVSAAVDKRLSESVDKPSFGLKPNEWASGNNLWLIAVAGDPRAMPTFLKTLGENEFKGRPVKMRSMGPDAKPIVKMLETAAQ